MFAWRLLRYWPLSNSHPMRICRCPCVPCVDVHVNVCIFFLYYCWLRLWQSTDTMLVHDVIAYDKIIRHMRIACALLAWPLYFPFYHFHPYINEVSHFRLNVNICGLICLTIIIIFDVIFCNARGVWFAYLQIYETKPVAVAINSCCFEKNENCMASFCPSNFFPFSFALVSQSNFLLLFLFMKRIF